jgi:TldD protein
METRQHELQRRRMMMVDGHLSANSRSTQQGLSARAYVDGYWGFASAPDPARAGLAAQMQDQARRNAQAMARFGRQPLLDLSGPSYQGKHRFVGKQGLSDSECTERLSALNAWCKSRFPQLKSTRFVISEENHHKALRTSSGADHEVSIQRAAMACVMVGEDETGAPIEMVEILSGKGNLADLDWSLETLAPLLAQCHAHLQAKRHAVAARGGTHTVVLAPELAGMLAHEAMGHPCEADAVLAGAVTADLLGQQVASELVSMVDVAHTWRGEEVMIPVYADDEGTPASDVWMIDKGQLKGFMHSRETAARLGHAATGNARAYNPGDEPLIRMRNTAIVPGQSRLQQMIEEVDNGYLLLKTGNGQADATTEFMFGITLAYEINQGKLGRAVRDTTVSGSAIKVLKSVDAVSDDMHWSCSGYCGKKQPMVVSMGGPALRAQAHLGGQ